MTLPTSDQEVNDSFPEWVRQRAGYRFEYRWLQPTTEEDIFHDSYQIRKESIFYHHGNDCWANVTYKFEQLVSTAVYGIREAILHLPPGGYGDLRQEAQALFANSVRDKIEEYLDSNPVTEALNEVPAIGHAIDLVNSALDTTELLTALNELAQSTAKLIQEIDDMRSKSNKVVARWPVGIEESDGQNYRWIELNKVSWMYSVECERWILDLPDDIGSKSFIDEFALFDELKGELIKILRVEISQETEHFRRANLLDIAQRAEELYKNFDASGDDDE